MTISLQEAKAKRETLHLLNTLRNWERELRQEPEKKRMADSVLHTACGLKLALDIQSGRLQVEQVIDRQPDAETLKASLIFEIVKMRAEISGISYDVANAFAKVKLAPHSYGKKP